MQQLEVDFCTRRWQRSVEEAIVEGGDEAILQLSQAWACTGTMYC